MLVRSLVWPIPFFLSSVLAAAAVAAELEAAFVANSYQGVDFWLSLRRGVASIKGTGVGMDEETRQLRRKRWLASKTMKLDTSTKEGSPANVVWTTSGRGHAAESSQDGEVFKLALSDSSMDDNDCSSVDSSKNSVELLKPKRKRSSYRGGDSRGDAGNRRGSKGSREVKAASVSATPESRSREAIDLTCDSSDSGCDSINAASAHKSTRKRPRAVRPKKFSTAAVPYSSSSSSKALISSTRTPPSSFDRLSFSTATYNVWFGPPHPETRMGRIASILLAASAARARRPETAGGGGGGAGLVFVGLQELTHPLASVLFPALRAGGYDIVAHDIPPNGYGCAVAALTRGPGKVQVLESGVRPYRDTIMGRGLVWVRARLDGGCDCANGKGERVVGGNGTEVLFCTTHLESYVPNYPAPGRTYNGAEQRQSQIREAARFCEEYARQCAEVRVAVVTGDLNWDDERVRATGNDPPLLSVINDGRKGGAAFASSSEWADSWRQARGPSVEGYTYDAKLSPMLGGNLRRRFDRCLIRAFGTTRVYAKDAELVGMDPIEGIMWRKEKKVWGGRGSGRSGGGPGQVVTLPVLPSDHFGLCVDITE